MNFVLGQETIKSLFDITILYLKYLQRHVIPLIATLKEQKPRVR
jgi:hypothetical protein